MVVLLFANPRPRRAVAELTGKSLAAICSASGKVATGNLN